MTIQKQTWKTDYAIVDLKNRLYKSRHGKKTVQKDNAVFYIEIGLCSRRHEKLTMQQQTWKTDYAKVDMKKDSAVDMFIIPESVQILTACCLKVVILPKNHRNNIIFPEKNILLGAPSHIHFTLGFAQFIKENI